METPAAPHGPPDAPVGEAGRESADPGARGRRLTRWLLAAILLAALALRLYGIDWDGGALFHPDERAILMHAYDLRVPAPGDFPGLLDARESPLNPGWFNYGSLPLYLLKLADWAASAFAHWDLYQLRFPGRAISAAADTATALVVFAIGSAWYGRRVGILAAALVALAVIHIQLSHFFAVDTILALLVTASVFFLARLAHSGSRRDAVLAGVAFGLALATKISAAPLVVAVIAAHLTAAFSSPVDAVDAVALSAARARRAAAGIALTLAVALVFMLVAQPYTVIDWSQFRANVTEQSEMVRRIVDYPYTRQYIGTPQYLYQARQLATWGLGPVLGAAAWAGLALAVVSAFRRRRKADIVILAWLLPYLAVTGWFDVKFLRYMLPAAPFLLLYGARLAWWLIDAIRRTGRARRLAAPAVLALLLVPTAHYALAFESIYAHDHPAQQASRWVKDNVPPGAVILKEHWEESLPDLYEYKVRELPLYNEDSARKLADMAAQLSEADYLVFFSNRLYGTLPRLPDRYPISTEYYRRLFAGDLGYELVFTADRPASFLGIGYRSDPAARVDLDMPRGFAPGGGGATLSFGWADESFTVYDHTRPMVFRNAARLGAEEIVRRVMERVPEAGHVGLMLTRRERSLQTAGGTFSDIVLLDRDAAAWSWLVWLLAVEVIGLAAMPLGFLLFRPLPNRGYLLHKTLGIVLVAFLAWLAASTGVAHFSRGSVLLSLVIVAAAGGLAGYRGRRELAGFLRERWRLVLFMEALFLAAFFAFLLIRVGNPDLWHPYRGGEKPMDFAYLNAVTRSTVMPPYDPWFAGGYLNYYYFGQFIVASLIRLTGIVPSIAYNLAVPTLFALTVGGAFTIVHGLADRARLRTRLRRPSARSAIVAGLAAVALVAVIGNIDGLVQVLAGARRALFDGLPFGVFDYWRSSRMMPPDPPGHEITEFPFFSFLFADLHAHLIAIPLALLTLGLSVSVFLRAADGEGGRWWSNAGGLAALALGIGVLRVTNSWDFPTALGLAGVAILGGELLSARGPLGSRLGRAVARIAFVAVLSHVLFLPFHSRFELSNDGVIRSETLTPLWRYFAIHSIFIFALAAYMATELRAALRRRGVLPVGAMLASLLQEGLPGAILLLAGAAAILAAIVATGQATVAFTLAAAAALVVLWALALRRRVADRAELAVVTGAAVAALGLGAFVDLFTIEGDIARMNTVFKFYLQAWVLLGVASAYLLWRVWAFGGYSWRAWAPGRAAWAAGFAALLAAVLVYPVMGTRVRLRDRFETSGPGIDGTAYADTAVYREPEGALTLAYDMAAIRWLQQNVEGSPTIIEGLTDSYRWGNRVSVYTGLPAVVGWDWHQRQQRVPYAEEVTRRRREVDFFYRTPRVEDALDVLREYGVRYVYVGELERNHYPEDGIAKFETMRDAGLVPVYGAGAPDGPDGPVTIYEFNDPAG